MMVLNFVEKNCILEFVLHYQHHHRNWDCNAMHESYLVLSCSSLFQHFLQPLRGHTCRGELSEASVAHADVTAAAPFIYS